MSGALVLCLIVAILNGLGALAWPVAGGGLGASAALIWGLYFLGVAAAQEAVFRGALLTALSRRLRFWPAALITSLAFAAIHLPIPGQTWIGLAAMAVFGLALCAAVRRFQSLGWVIGFHWAWDVVLTPALGFGAASGRAVIWRCASVGPAWLSGGTGGPEASVVTVCGLALLFAVLAWRGGKTRR